ncbi:LCP family protein [Euzebya sp.]|uniref:LCP family protein n=1 Tax=Euzebya sp. TaxID=1971409 RepID=UPI00351514D1
MRARGIRSAIAVGVALAVLAVGTMAAALDGLARTGLWRGGYNADDLLVVLAIGSDRGPPYRPGDPAGGLADGIHLFVVDTATARMTVIDIPRDSAIGGTKVNAHLRAGGPAGLESQLEAWTGLPIDFWVLGTFLSVERMVHILGGVPVDVPQRMADPFSGTDLQPGPQVLGPGQALAFTRDRKSLADGDIGRSRNQTRLMLAALEHVRSAADGNLAYLVSVVGALRQHTLSNVPSGEVLPLAVTALRIQPDAIEQVTLSGPFGTIDGGSVIYPQPGGIFERLRAGQVGPQQ